MSVNSTAAHGAPAFSSDSAEAIRRLTELGQSQLPSVARSDECLKEYFEMNRCTQFVSNTPGFRRVALQFPDSLLRDSPRVAQLIKEATRTEVVVLGDTSYGSCCVDEVAAEHVQSDCIIHFGPSCLTRTKRLPVLHIFGREPIDVDSCATAFRRLFPDMESHVLMMCDTVYAYCLESLKDCLAKDYKNVVFSCLSGTHPDAGGVGIKEGIPTQSQDDSKRIHMDSIQPNAGGTWTYRRFGWRFALAKPVEEYQVFYIGAEGPTLSNLLLNYSRCQFHSYNPVTMVSRKEGLNVNKALGKRYFLIQKAKEATTVGILMGTLGAADYLEIVQRIKAVLKHARKKYYSIAMGKLNPAKLANFMEIDIFVLVSCPENSLIDSQDFYRPIITPFELEIACLRSEDWGTRYTTDYQDLITGVPVPFTHDSDPNKLLPEYSLINGRLITSNITSGDDDSLSSTLAEKSYGKLAVCSSAAEFLHSRSWQGLEQRLGENSVEKAVLGECGIPRMYAHELEQLDKSVHP